MRTAHALPAPHPLCVMPCLILIPAVSALFPPRSGLLVYPELGMLLAAQADGQLLLCPLPKLVDLPDEDPVAASDDDDAVRRRRLDRPPPAPGRSPFGLLCCLCATTLPRDGYG
jgi:hypothetical protein